MCYVAENHNYMCHIRAKGFLDSNLNRRNFHKIAPYFTHSQNRIFKISLDCWKRIDQLLLPYKFHGKDM